MDAFERLREHVKATNQRDFAEELGTSQGQISKWVHRLVRPSLVILPKLNKILGTTFEDWLAAKVVPGGEAPPKPRRHRVRGRKAA